MGDRVAILSQCVSRFKWNMDDLEALEAVKRAIEVVGEGERVIERYFADCVVAHALEVVVEAWVEGEGRRGGRFDEICGEIVNVGRFGNETICNRGLSVVVGVVGLRKCRRKDGEARNALLSCVSGLVLKVEDLFDVLMDICKLEEPMDGKWGRESAIRALVSIPEASDGRLEPRRFFRRLGRAIGNICVGVDVEGGSLGAEDVVEVVQRLFQVCRGRELEWLRGELLPEFCDTVLQRPGEVVGQVCREVLGKGEVDVFVVEIMLKLERFRMECRGDGLGKEVLSDVVGPFHRSRMGLRREVMERGLVEWDVPLWGKRSAICWALGRSHANRLGSVDWEVVMRRIPLGIWAKRWSGVASGSDFSAQEVAERRTRSEYLEHLTTLILLGLECGPVENSESSHMAALSSPVLLALTAGVQARLGAPSEAVRMQAMRVGEALTRRWTPDHPLVFEDLADRRGVTSLWNAAAVDATAMGLEGLPLDRAKGVVGMQDSESEDEDGELAVSISRPRPILEQHVAKVHREEALVQNLTTKKHIQEMSAPKLASGSDVLAHFGLGLFPKQRKASEEEETALWTAVRQQGMGLVGDGGGFLEISSYRDQETSSKKSRIRRWPIPPNQVVRLVPLTNAMKLGDGSRDPSSRPPPSFLGEALAGLEEQEDAEWWTQCVSLLGPLLRGALSDPSTMQEAQSAAPTVLSRVLVLQNPFALSDVPQWIHDAAVAAVIAAPQAAGFILADNILGPERTLAQRHDALAAAADAAAELAGLRDAQSETWKAARALLPHLPPQQLSPTASDLPQTTTPKKSIGESEETVIVHGVKRPRTRRWGSGRRETREFGANSFANIGPRWIATILHRLRDLAPSLGASGSWKDALTSRITIPVDLFGSNATLLAAIIRTLGLLLLCVRGTSSLPNLAALLLEFLWYVREHPHSAIRRSTLATIVLVAQALFHDAAHEFDAPASTSLAFAISSPSRNPTLAAILSQTIPWIVSSAKHDPDAGCRDQAQLALQSPSLRNILSNNS